ncbi:rare lipoprotein A precursor [Salmonella enterica subsp. enterica]|uniref:Rare lipoprotein A n=1 Tax=Salmonella enterica I TaxID=59201 RepID=A0A379WDT7_SALET|nr:rare lipoprotein A precursor [Salmonella enterica subsp. enterica]
MRKQLPVICVAAGIVLLAACTNDGGQQQTTVAPQPAVCNGPTVEISGAEPRYEPLNPTANQDYQRDGKSYKSFRTRPALARLAWPLFMMRNPAVI